jgi:DNA polymerase III subunit delta'
VSEAPVLDQVPGQDQAVAFLRHAAPRPHHAYLFAGPEGGGKQIAARAFAAALLCSDGGCGECRACTLALAERHPNMFVIEPEGRDIHVDTVRAEVWHPAYRTPPEPGRKIFLIREADRLNPSAADVLLKVLEEPPSDAVLLLLSARPDELPETVISRCHVVTFLPLPESFVVDSLVAEGIPEATALLAARLAGGNLGRARRMSQEGGLDFREAALEALAATGLGPPGALAAADGIIDASAAHKKRLRESFDEELEQFTDERGRVDDAYRGVVRRLQERHHRQERRAERDFIDRVLLSVSSILRDRIVTATGGDRAQRMNVDLETGGDPVAAARALGAVEEARAALADETNLNPRLVLEDAFLQVVG